MTNGEVTGHFVPVVIGKAVVVELSTDFAEVLVAEPSIAKAVPRTARQIYVIGASLGQTNLYFFDSNHRQISSLNIAVLFDTPAPQIQVFWGPLMNQAGGGIVAGDPSGSWFSLNCTPSRCVKSIIPGSNQPPGTTNSNVNVLTNTPGNLTAPINVPLNAGPPPRQ